MSLADTARTRRSDTGYAPVSVLPFPYGASIQTEKFLLSIPGTKINFPGSQFAYSLNLYGLGLNGNQDVMACDTPLGTSAQYGANTVLDWLTAPAVAEPKSERDQLLDAVRSFFEVAELAEIGINFNGEEKEVYVFLNTKDRPDELLSRLINIEESVQRQMSSTYFSFNYIPLCGRQAREIVPPSTLWVKK